MGFQEAKAIYPSQTSKLEAKQVLVACSVATVWKLFND
jgi:hypothetical protein